MKLVLIVCLLAYMAESAEDKIRHTYFHNNQIMFQEQGKMINKAVFVHVAFKVDMGPALTLIDEIVAKLKEVNEMEAKNEKIEILPYLMGSNESDSIWRNNETSELWRQRSKDGVVITGMLFKMFNRQVDKLNGALMTIPRHYNVNKGQHIHERTKRFIFGGIALGFALHNSHRIGNLEEHFMNLTSKHNLLVDSVTLLSDKHKQLAVDTALLKDMVKFLAHKNYHKIITLVSVLNDQLKDAIGEVRSVVQAGQQRRVSKELIYGLQLAELFDALKRKAETLGCKMILEHPSDLYEIESTYGYDKDGKSFAIYIHVPMYEQEEELQLWEYIPFPILQSATTNSTIIPQTGKNDYIAMIPDKNAKTNHVVPPHRYRVLNEAELDRCYRIRDVYLCGGRNTLRTDIQNSCIGSLYLREHDLISKNCDFEIGPSQEFVAKVGPNKWMVFAPRPFSTNAECGNSKQNVRFETQTLIELPGDCKVEVRDIYLSTDVNINLDFKLQRFDWAYDGNIFNEFLTDDREVAEMIQEMISTKSKFGLKDLSHLKHRFTYAANSIDKIWTYLTSLPFKILGWFDDIFLALAIVGAAILIFMLWRRGFFSSCTACSQRRSTDAPVRRVRFQRNDVVVPDRNFNEAIGEANPPPYATLNEPSAPRRASTGGMGRTDSTLSIDSRYDPSQLVEDRQRMMETVHGECNPGPIIERGRRMKDWVCSHHVTRGQPGHCSGYFRPAREEQPHGVRPHNIEDANVWNYMR